VTFVISLVVFKLVWAWVVPDLFPGAVAHGLIIADLMWLAAFKLAVLVAALSGFHPALVGDLTPAVISSRYGAQSWRRLMKAVVTTKYGPPDVLELQKVEKPTPKDNKVLIKIYATTVTAGDCEMQSLKLPLGYQLMLRMGFGFRRPRKKIPGTEVAGEVEAIGKNGHRSNLSVGANCRGSQVCRNRAQKGKYSHHCET
jgi:hypothetical protein